MRLDDGGMNWVLHLYVFCEGWGVKDTVDGLCLVMTDLEIPMDR